MRVSVPTDDTTTAELRRIGASHADAYKTGAATLIAEAAKDTTFHDGRGWETIITPINGIPTRFRARTIETGPGYDIYFTERMQWVAVVRLYNEPDQTYAETTGKSVTVDVVLHRDNPSTLVAALHTTTAPDEDLTVPGFRGMEERLTQILAGLYVRDVCW